MPFGEYEDFADCVAQNQDKDDPEAYCAVIQQQVEEESKGTGRPDGASSREARAFSIFAQAAEMRDDDLRPRIVLRPIVFDSLSDDLGGFREVIRPAAVVRTFREGIDVRALVDHDTSKILGRLSAGTLRLVADARGLLVEIDPANTSYARDLIVSVRRGDITGGSFSFEVVRGGEAWDEDARPPMREILDMRIFEVSAVTFPAYPQTEAALRSLRRRRAVSRGRVMQKALRQQRAAMNR